MISARHIVSLALLLCVFPALPGSAQFALVSSFTLPAGIEGSVAWGDYDNDGMLDAVVTGLQSGFTATRILHNMGGAFTESFPGTLPPAASGEAAWGDYDNDGLLDLILTGANYSLNPATVVGGIYHNTGNGFTEVYAGTLQTGPGCAAWGDLDNDGRLDIVRTVTGGQISQSSKIFHNTGNGFIEVYPGTLQAVMHGSLALGDYDNDGRLDILTAGDPGNWQSCTNLYHNTGSGFIAAYQGSLAQLGFGWHSVAWGDYDNDGLLDILLTGGTSYNGGDTSRVYHNTGSGFQEAFPGTLTSAWGGSTAWGDFDNDGLLDILLTGEHDANNANQLISKIYRNAGTGFQEVFAGTLLPVWYSSVAWGDYDNDGRLDILLAGGPTLAPSFGPINLYRNTTTVLSNSVPSAPSGLSATVIGNNVTLHWNKATDAETPQNGLTYQLRVGTVPNGIDVLSPMADVGTGQRRVVQMGNANEATSYPLEGLPAGTYCWSVQAIDSAFAGSPFAPEGCFVIDEPLGRICGRKFNDLNGNGVRDAGEPGIPNWTIHLSTPVSHAFAVTDGAGYYCFSVPPGTYEVCESSTSGWVATTPECALAVITSGAYTTADFGNTRTGPSDCVSPPDDLVAWWPLDEVAGPTAHDIGGLYPNDATYAGTPTSVVALVQLGLQFDGVDDYLEVSDQSELNVDRGDFSIDAWILMQSSVGTHTIVDKRAINGHAATGYLLFASNGYLCLQLADGTHTNYCSNLAVADGYWHHIAVTVERASSTGIRWYIDGIVGVTTNDPTAHQDSLTNSTPLLIGRNAGTEAFWLEGALDEVEIFARVLTGGEVQAIFSAGACGKCKRL